MIKQELHLVKGMQKDTSISKFNPEFVFDAQNIRITARDNNTLLSVTNERGNDEVKLKEKDGSPAHILGTIIGHCVLNNFLVLFTTGSDGDIIYRLEYKDNYFETVVLYNGTIKGSLKFNTENPIETLGVYENDNIQKVYWVDGSNPIRMINIMSTQVHTKDSFNVVPTLKLGEVVNIEKKQSGGYFSHGVIQYAFSYYNLYGRESNIFYVSPLYYLSYKDRGASPEEVVDNSFDIRISGVDTSFDYVRIFSIFRSSINATPVVKRVADIKTTSKELYFTDTGDVGDTIDSIELLYIGGEEVVAGTICSKDNTLFLGNIELSNQYVDESIRNSINGGTISFVNGNDVYLGDPTGYYSYNNQLDRPSNEIKTFKYLEWYRFGIQFQNKIGKWSEPVYINDCKVNIPVAIGKNSFRPVIAKYILDSSIISELGDYKKVRPVIVYPSINKRSCIAQGVVCPTVYNVEDRYNNSPYCQSSWFFRVSGFKEGSKDYGAVYGASATALHDYPIGGNGDISDEIQCMWNSPRPFLGYRHPDAFTISQGSTIKYILEPTDTEEWVKKNCNNFYVDSSIFTLHSPDVEFDSNVQNINYDNLKFRIVGYSKLTSFQSKKDVQASTPCEVNPSNVFEFTGALGFNDVYIDKENLSEYGSNLRISNTVWFDYVTKGAFPKYKSEFVVYPWQRIGSLNNSPNSDNQPSKLLYNRTSNLRYSFCTRYINNIWTPSAHKCNIVTDKLCKVNTNYKSIVYYSDVDRTVPIPYTKKDIEGEEASTDSWSYPIMVGTTQTNKPDNYRTQFVPLSMGSGITEDKYLFSDNPVHITYKSSPHAIIALDTINDVQYILPTNASSQTKLLNQSLFYNKDIRKVHQDTISGIENDYDFLWVGELYRDVSSGEEVFGDYDSNDNLWIPAGEPLQLPDLPNVNLTIHFTEGDTYFQRYDHIKTMPNSLEDTNQVTEVCSFMCETRVNIDGRYDRNRGVPSFTVNADNFNKINEVYSQSNNYFNYRIPDYELNTITKFPTTVTWTKEKQNGSKIDNWTNLTLASTIDLDGSSGAITSLNTFNNEIYCFQKTGLSTILFNNRVQIPVSDGVPIEISNSAKVEGKRYISNIIGCNNKWSITETPLGVYFIDSTTNSIYLFNGQILSLSDKLGFNQWISNNSSFDKWDPINFGNFITYYDKSNNDVYFINSETALVYSELLGQFISFMSYNRVPIMFNINNDFYAIQNNTVWKQFAGDYNMFFGKYCPYSITFISNADEPYDKIFNTIEFRADCWTKDNLGNEVLASNNTFDTLEVWNEYQKGETPLTFSHAGLSNLKKKFRVWRANIPRANTDWNGVKANNRDRIRNTWAYIKLSMNEENTDRMEFHDMSVYYSI